MLIKEIQFKQDIGLLHTGFTTAEGEPNTVKDIVEDIGSDSVYIYMLHGTKVTVKGYPYVLLVNKE